MDGKSRVCRLIALLEGQETAAQIEENSVVFFLLLQSGCLSLPLPTPSSWAGIYPSLFGMWADRKLAQPP